MKHKIERCDFIKYIVISINSILIILFIIFNFDCILNLTKTLSRNEFLILIFLSINILFVLYNFILKILNYLKKDEIERRFLKTKALSIFEKYASTIYFWCVLIFLIAYNIINWEDVIAFESFTKINGNNLIFIVSLFILVLTIMKEVRLQIGDFSLELQKTKFKQRELDAIESEILNEIANNNEEEVDEQL